MGGRGLLGSMTEGLRPGRRATAWSAPIEPLSRRFFEPCELPAQPQSRALAFSALDDGLVADELRKLVELRNEGALTEPEFRIQKRKLLR